MSTKKDNADCKKVSSTSSSAADDNNADAETTKTSKPATDIPVANTVVHEICVAQGCKNVPITHPEWDHEYCSIKCCYNHCRIAFENWLANNKMLKSKSSKATVSSSQKSLPGKQKDGTSKKS